MRDYQTGLPPFTGQSQLRVDVSSRTPMGFFHALFQESMWEKIAKETNDNWHLKFDHKLLSAPKNSRLKQWEDVSAGDIKIVFAHLIAMGVTKKANIETYWSQNPIIRTPFFGEHMSRNRFQSIYWSMHLADDAGNPPVYLGVDPKTGKRKKNVNHDSLLLVKPFLDMCNETFKAAYSPDRDIAYDEATCGFKGRIHFRQYNPSKPHKYHIKIYSCNESKSGYCLGFDVYTGEHHHLKHKNVATKFRNASLITKQVLSHLNEIGILDKGHRLYIDNWYSSVQLMRELYNRKTPATGTLRKNRGTGAPTALLVSKQNKQHEQKLEVGGKLARWNVTDDCYLMCMKYFAKKKKICYFLSAVNGDAMIEFDKKDWVTKKKKKKPLVAHEYTMNMGGTDRAGQILQNYKFLRPARSWAKTLWLYLFHSLLVNSFLLHKKFKDPKMRHRAFRCEVIQGLLREGIQDAYGPPRAVTYRFRPVPAEHLARPKRLTERHFLVPINYDKGDGKRKTQPRNCEGCNFTSKELYSAVPTAERYKGKISQKRTSYKCFECDVPLCIYPCFKFFHTKDGYREDLLKFRAQGEDGK